MKLGFLKKMQFVMKCNKPIELKCVKNRSEYFIYVHIHILNIMHEESRMNGKLDETIINMYSNDLLWFPWHLQNQLGSTSYLQSHILFMSWLALNTFSCFSPVTTRLRDNEEIHCITMFRRLTHIDNKIIRVT